MVSDKLQNMISRVHQVLERDIQPLIGKTPPFILFFSFTDTQSRAQTLTVTAGSFKDCWNAGLEKLQQTITKSGMEPKWLRVDWVESTEEIDKAELIRRLQQVKRNYFRYGISLDERFQTAFLETELNGNAMLYGGPSVTTATLNEANFNRYAKRSRGFDKISVADVEKFHVFSTQALFTTDDDDEVHSIPGAGPNTGRRTIEMLSIADIDGLIERGSHFLETQVGEDGRFIYGWHPCFDNEIKTYNTLRHTSTLYAMLESWEVTKDQALIDAIERGLQHLTDKLIKTVNQDGKDLAFLTEKNGEIKLGGNAVCLLALVKYSELTGTDRYLPLLEKLALGIVHMQDQQSGKFNHVLNYPSLSIKEPFRIIYYDGEAAFGLMRLYSLTRDARWLEAVEKAFHHFIEADHWEAHDHWLSYAVNELTRYRPEQKYYEFGIRNFADYLDFVSNRITTFPTLLELMMAAQQMVSRIEADPKLAPLLAGVDLKKFYFALERRAHHLLNGHFWPELAMFYANPEKITGSFFIRHHAFRIRIDDVEHYLSGFVAYRKYRLAQQQAEERRVALPAALQLERPLIGLMRAKGRPGPRSLATAHVAATQGITLYFFTPSDVNITENAINALKFEHGQWIRQRIGVPHIIDNDESSRSSADIWKALERQSKMTTIMLGGKAITLQKLRDANLFTDIIIPDLRVSDPDAALAFIEQHREVVFKPVRGAQGNSVSLIRAENGAYSIQLGAEKQIVSAEDIKAFLSQTFPAHRYLAQKYIHSQTPSGLPFDIRLHLQRGEGGNWKTTKIYARIGQGKTITSNIAGGGSIADGRIFVHGQFGPRADEVWSRLLNIAQEFPEKFQHLYDKPIDAMGLDLGLDEGGQPWLFEVNSCPGTKFFEFDEALIRVGYLKHLASQVNGTPVKSDSDVPALSDVVTAFTGEPVSNSNAAISVANLAIDNALPAKNSVGLLYASGDVIGASKTALEKGKDRLLAIIGESATPPFDDVPYFRTRSLREGLFNAAASRRAEFKGSVFSVGGSVGKTSTAHLLAHALRRLGKVVGVNGAGNIPEYVATGMATMPLNRDCLVFEIAGATAPDKEPIGLTSARIIKPDICILTAITPAHMDKMGTIERAARIKAAAFKGLSPMGTAIVNRDTEQFDIIKQEIPTSVRLLTFGRHEDADIKWLGRDAEDHIEISIFGTHMSLPFNISRDAFVINGLSVIAALIAEGVTTHDAALAIDGWTPLAGRGAVVDIAWKDGQIQLIDDAYNANPASMTTALRELAALKTTGRRIAVLSEMAELGDKSKDYHTELAHTVRDNNIDQIFLLYSDAYSGFWNEIRTEQRASKSPALDTLKAELIAGLLPGDTLLIKGSNATGLHKLSRWFRELPEITQ
ncbi:YheC/YheD family protein [Brucella sp.]|uniref:YheC/YheD family protein n=1 Tax=Brucella sp. TaxID=52132 RepID=UPI0028B1D97A|nr:YheC/YheD family protein [Brucella sp.]